MSFNIHDNFLYCEGQKVADIQSHVSTSPFYLYSSAQIRQNFAAYENAFQGISCLISYAIKANGNLTLLKILRNLGSWATLVSGGELKLGLNAGFTPHNLIFNGNGKTISELELAIDNQVIVNIDSSFDIIHIQNTAEKLRKTVKVFLRINPDIDPGVHPYVSTGLRESKFGLSMNQIPQILTFLKKMPQLNLIGIHCHLGSMITQMEVFRKLMQNMALIFEDIKTQGFPLQFLNIGGGLGINYHHSKTSFPTPDDLALAIRDTLPQNATLILEPGRSMIGNAGVLVCRVIGVKQNDFKNFIVIDGSMTELIRPSLYQAYHHIGFIEPVNGEEQIFDIVGPVCESTDFIGYNRLLPTPSEGTGLVVYDTGAYGFVMASNYNARVRPPEFLVDGEKLLLIRRGETFADQLRFFDEREI